MSPSDVFIHPAALVESEFVGSGSRIWAFTHVMAGARIGRDCNVGDHCYIEGRVIIGDRVTVKNSIMLWDGVTVEDDVFIGPGALFTNDRYPRSARMPAAAARYRDAEWLQSTLVRCGASIGAGAIILGGSVIGRFALIAAGAVVARDVPDHTIAVGNPATARGFACICGQPLHFTNSTGHCRQCGRRFDHCAENGDLRLTGHGSVG